MDIISDKEISVFDNNVNYDFSGVENFNKITIFNFEDNKTKDYLENVMEENKIRTFAEGLHTILPNKDLMVEETESGRLALFGSDGSLKWQYINKTIDNDVYRLNWSRFLDSKKYSDVIKTIYDKK